VGSCAKFQEERRIPILSLYTFSYSTKVGFGINIKFLGKCNILLGFNSTKFQTKIKNHDIHQKPDGCILLVPRKLIVLTN
jgi:hypothetical protein